MQGFPGHQYWGPAHRLGGDSLLSGEKGQVFSNMGGGMWIVYVLTLFYVLTLVQIFADLQFCKFLGFLQKQITHEYKLKILI